MGTDAAEVVGTVRNSVKVHRMMCTELMSLLDRILSIFPKIEEARPRCASGIQALCLLNSGIEKAKGILQSCSDGSKLYLAVTGDAIVSRFKRTRSVLEQSLSQIQDMVPVTLAVEISQIVDDLSRAAFVMDPSEEEAGKVLKELLQQGTSASDSMENSEIRSLQTAASRLHITSPKTILIEKRSIKKLLDKVGARESSKRKILTYFMYLLKKYGDFIMGEQTESPRHQGSSAFENSGNVLMYNQEESRPRRRENEVESNFMGRPVLPEEFRCPISSRLMYDPVVIASGQTYERMWIQKWFDEGHDTCPKTDMKLPHMSLTPNVVIKELISSWCTEYGVTISDPTMLPALNRWETSSNSIASLSSSMNDLHLQMDLSNISLGSIDASYSSDSSRAKFASGLSLMQTDNVSGTCQTYGEISETNLELLSNLGELSWEARCKIIEDLINRLKCNDKASYSLSSENFVAPLVTFLKKAIEMHDVKAQRDGLQLFLTFCDKNRNGIPYLGEDAFALLVSFLNSEVTEEVFSILELLSAYPYCRHKITDSGALSYIVKALDSPIRAIQERAIKTLKNLSTNADICLQIATWECIPQMVSLFGDKAFVGDCLCIMKNLCNTEEARISVAETSGCIASIVEVLDGDSHEEQEQAVSILLSLCSQRLEYCQMVMDEGVIPPLVYISNNGSDRAKGIALELLRQLKDVNVERESLERVEPEVEDNRSLSNQPNEKKSSKASGIFGRKMFMFSKHGKKK
ncbi:hypothetical protein UlMin_039540 [Ulmus minor]